MKKTKEIVSIKKTAQSIDLESVYLLLVIRPGQYS